MRAAAHHTVCVLSEPLQREQRVVWLNNHIAHLILVWKNRVSLYQLLWIPEKKTFFLIFDFKTVKDLITKICVFV